MCFSAEASFTAAALLSVIGFAAVSETKRRKEIFLALLPLVFALQQFSEGVLWVALEHGFYPSLWSQIAGGVFLFVAFVTWPVWLPLSLYLIEKEGWRKRVILATLMAGILFAIGNLVAVAHYPLTVKA